MNVVSFRSLGALALCFLLVNMLSCARDQQLVGISIAPSTETFGASDIPVTADAGLSVQLRAIGHYIHPPVTKDITSQVTWVSNTPGIATVDSSGLLAAAGVDCGDALVSATVQTNHSAGDRPSSGAIVTGTMTATVVCFTGTGGGGGGTSPTLTVDIIGTGTVSSSPAGISNCSTQCAATFTSNTPITLIATPTAPATTVTWNGCTPEANPLLCDLTITANTTVNATFQ